MRLGRRHCHQWHWRLKLLACCRELKPVLAQRCLQELLLHQHSRPERADHHRLPVSAWWTHHRCLRQRRTLLPCNWAVQVPAHPAGQHHRGCKAKSQLQRRRQQHSCCWRPPMHGQPPHWHLALQASLMCRMPRQDRRSPTCPRQVAQRLSQEQRHHRTHQLQPTAQQWIRSLAWQQHPLLSPVSCLSRIPSSLKPMQGHWHRPASRTKSGGWEYLCHWNHRCPTRLLHSALPQEVQMHLRLWLPHQG
mmetsp:Transcript_104796/g.306018  ORF Transcript_104796/g.306018 Transcript_104796/m.306018 type:complete len:248 (+) Transcript_104796:836-1579(+)